MNFNVHGTMFFVIFFSIWRQSHGECYFPQQFQGEFVMQTTTNLGTGTQYTTVNITSTAITIWGNCHRRKGNNNFILMLKYVVPFQLALVFRSVCGFEVIKPLIAENEGQDFTCSSGHRKTETFGIRMEFSPNYRIYSYRETSCIRCLHLKLRSANVLQVFTLNSEINSKCYTSEKLAEDNCPSEESLANRKAAEILLFKRSGYYTRKEYCPIDGKYSISYKSHNPSQINECTGYDSSLDSCPSGSTLNFRLRACTSAPNYIDLRFECLASWNGPNNENYLIFSDDSLQINSQKPKYRCARYYHDYRTDEIKMALSRDSTCTNDLINSTYGFETFLLTPKPENPWPAEASFGICSFPKWMQGDWEHIRVDADTMIYRDHSSFKTYTIKCVGVREEENKFLVFSRTQCDEERYNCMRIVERSDNILEFQLGSNASTTKDDVYTLCSDDNFLDNSWITQGRLEVIEDTPSGQCPISGEYVGVIPDGEDLCAKLWSSCENSELMYYEVSHCSRKEIYEQREYRCLGHWRESENLYTYTQRRDVAAGTYECFVGVKMSNHEIFIREAGEHCQRNIDPLHYGMQLNQTSVFTCNYTRPQYPPVRTTKVPLRPYGSTTTLRSITKVWNFDTEGAETKNDNTSSTSRFSPTYLICIIVYRLFM